MDKIINRKKKVSLKQNLRNNKLTIGSWITLGHPSVAEIMANEGFDWLLVDMEHSALTLHQAQQLIQIIELCGVSPLVRVGENNANLIKRAMDMGAQGVIVPMVNTKDQAINAVKSVKYPPFGARGVGLARAQGYGLEFDRYNKWINNQSVVIVQIEHIQSITNLEDILSVEGVDASIIGPYDLSASLGYPGEFHRKEVKNAIKKYMQVCKKVGKPAGIHVITPETTKLKACIKKGFKFIGFSLDTMFLGLSIRKSLKSI